MLPQKIKTITKNRDENGPKTGMEAKGNDFATACRVLPLGRIQHPA
jgi:hypothetical protein